MQTKQTKQIMSLINKAVKYVGTSRQALQDAIDATVRHAWQHGDVSLINRLMAELPKGVQIEKIRQYLLEVAPVRPNKAADMQDKGYYKYRKLSDDSEKISLSILSDCAWYDYQAMKADKAEVTTGQIFTRHLKAMLKQLQQHTDLNTLEQQALIALEAAVNSRVLEATK
jgi:hypothetical protein